LYPELQHDLGARLVRRRVASFYFDAAYAAYRRGQLDASRVALRRALAHHFDARSIKLAMLLAARGLNVFRRGHPGRYGAIRGITQ
jgi:hypothetical protein